METKPKRTPLTYRQSDVDRGRYIITAERITVGIAFGEENAICLTRCCNAHDGLVTALEAALPALQNRYAEIGSVAYREIYEQAMEALADAEVQP